MGLRHVQSWGWAPWLIQALVLASAVALGPWDAAERLCASAIGIAMACVVRMSGRVRASSVMLRRGLIAAAVVWALATLPQAAFLLPNSPWGEFVQVAMYLTSAVVSALSTLVTTDDGGRREPRLQRVCSAYLLSACVMVELYALHSVISIVRVGTGQILVAFDLVGVAVLVAGASLIEFCSLPTRHNAFAQIANVGLVACALLLVGLGHGDAAAVLIPLSCLVVVFSQLAVIRCRWCGNGETALVELLLSMTLAALVANEGAYGDGRPYGSTGGYGYLTPLTLGCLAASVATLVLLARRGRMEDDKEGQRERYLLSAEEREELSTRELDAIEGAVSGETVRQTADRMGLSPGTVSTYRSRGLRKLGVRTMTELLARLRIRQVNELLSDEEEGLDAHPLAIVLACVVLLLYSCASVPSAPMAWLPRSIERVKTLAVVAMLLGCSLVNLGAYDERRRVGMMATAAVLLLAMLYSCVASARDVESYWLQGWGWALCLVAGMVAAVGVRSYLPTDLLVRSVPLWDRTLLLVAAGFAQGLAVACTMACQMREEYLALAQPLTAIPYCLLVVSQVSGGRVVTRMPSHALSVYGVGQLLGSIGLLGVPLIRLGEWAIVLLWCLGESLAIAVALRVRRDAARGQAVLREYACGGLGKALRGYGLTEVQMRVAEMLLLGYGVPRISDELVVSPETVASHKREVYRKAGVHSQRALIEKVSGRG